MKAFPMFIRTSGCRVVIVGGGEQAAQKARLICKTDARIVLVAQTLEDELQGLVASGRAEQVETLSPVIFEDAAFAFIGSGCPGLDAAAHGIAKAAKCPVNVVDQPDLCDLTTPAIVDRDPIVVAIGSEGTAPVLARNIKTQIETLLPQNLGGLAALAGNLRLRVAQKIARERRRAFWTWVFKGEAAATWTRGAEGDAARMIKTAISDGGAPARTRGGHIALVGAGPGARDLLTLRAVERLQEADIIFYDRLVDPEVLELARRDADRVFVGKVVGAHAWPQDKISGMIVAEALKGRNVVRLKSGDPAIFGRATEEIAAAKAAGIPVEMVPGVTAASAAAASLGRSLTERGVADTFVVATGMGCAENPLPDCTRLSGPGTTTAFYMSVGQAPRVSCDLMKQGLPPETKVDVCVDVSKSSERHIVTTVSDLPRALEAHLVKSCAIILVNWPINAVPVQPVQNQPSAIWAMA